MHYRALSCTTTLGTARPTHGPLVFSTWSNGPPRSRPDQPVRRMTRRPRSEVRLGPRPWLCCSVINCTAGGLDRLQKRYSNNGLKHGRIIGRIAEQVNYAVPMAAKSFCCGEYHVISSWCATKVSQLPRVESDSGWCGNDLRILAAADECFFAFGWFHIVKMPTNGKSTMYRLIKSNLRNDLCLYPEIQFQLGQAKPLQSPPLT